MTDELDLQKILQMLKGMVGGGNQYQRMQYGGRPQHFTSAYQYQPGMADMALDFLSPHRQRMAPPVVTQASWNEMQRASQARSQRAASTYDMNPMAFRLAELALDKVTGGRGFQTLSTFKDEQPFLYGMIKPAVNQLFGKGMAGQKQETFQDVSRYLSGRTFGSGVRARMGAPLDVSEQITQGLYGATYKDTAGTGLMKRFRHFEVQDMGDIMRLGMDYGMDTQSKGGKIDVKKITEQTKNLANVIQAGMGIYKTMDKEKVIQNLMEITRGQVPITDTATLENALHKFNAMAKSVGTSVAYLQKISAQSARLFESIGVGGHVGAQMGAGGMGFITAATRGPDKIYTAREVSELGGVQTMRQRRLKMDAIAIGSTAYAEGGMAYMAAQSGLISADPAMIRQQMETGGSMAPYKAQMRTKLAEQFKAQGVSDSRIPGLVRTKMQVLQGKGATGLSQSVLEQGGAQELGGMRSRMQLNDVLSFAGIDMSPTEAIARMRKDPAFKSMVELEATRYLTEAAPGIAEPGSENQYARQLVSSSMVSAATLRQRDTNILAAASTSKYVERNASRTSMFENIKEAISFRGKDGSPILAAFKKGIPGTSIPILRDAEGKLLKVTPERAKAYFEAFGGVKGLEEAAMLKHSKNALLSGVMSNIYGITGYGPGEISLGRGIAEVDAINKHRNITEEQFFANMKDNKLFAKLQGFNLDEARSYFSDKEYNAKTLNQYFNTKLKDGDKLDVLSSLTNKDSRDIFHQASGLIKNKSFMSYTKAATRLVASAPVLRGPDAVEKILGEKDFDKMKKELHVGKWGDMAPTSVTRLHQGLAKGWSKLQHDEESKKVAERKQTFGSTASYIKFSKNEFITKARKGYVEGRNVDKEEYEGILKQMGKTPEEFSKMAEQTIRAITTGDDEQIKSMLNAASGTRKGELKKDFDFNTHLKRTMKATSYLLGTQGKTAAKGIATQMESLTASFQALSTPSDPKMKEYAKSTADTLEKILDVLQTNNVSNDIAKGMTNVMSKIGNVFMGSPGAASPAK